MRITITNEEFNNIQKILVQNDISLYERFNEEFKKSILLQSDGVSLSGCIEKNGHLGKIDISPFEITIKGLDTEFDFQHSFKRSDWDNLIGFLQHKAIGYQNN